MSLSDSQGYKRWNVSEHQKRLTSVKTKTKDRPIIPAGMMPKRLKNVNFKQANIWSGVPTRGSMPRRKSADRKSSGKIHRLTEEALLVASREVGLEVNTEKPKYVVIYCH